MAVEKAYGVSWGSAAHSAKVLKKQACFACSCDFGIKIQWSEGSQLPHMYGKALLYSSGLLGTAKLVAFLFEILYT